MKIKDNVYIGSELMFGKLIFLKEKGNSSNFIECKNRKFVLNVAEYTKYVRKLKNLGVNAFRALPSALDPVDVEKKEKTSKIASFEYFVPHKWVMKNTWDLNVFEESYFATIDKMLGILLNDNVNNTVFCMPMFDNCTNLSGYGSWKHNVNNIHSFLDAKAKKYVKKLIDKYINTFKNYLEKIIFELGNEIDDVEFAFYVYEYLLHKGIKPENISLGINLNLNPNDENGDAMKKLRAKIRNKSGVTQLRKSFFVVHGHLRKDSPRFGKLTDFAIFEAGWIQQKKDKNKLNIRTFVSTDGTGDGNSKCDVYPRKTAKYRRRPSFAQWKPFLKFVFEKCYLKNSEGYPLIYLEQFIKKQDISCISSYYVQFAKIYKESFKKFPYNYGKFKEIEADLEDEKMIKKLEKEIKSLKLKNLKLMAEIEKFKIKPEKWKFYKGFYNKFPFIKFDFLGLWQRYKTFIILFFCSFIIGLIL
jgi:hypothetical protein